MKRYEPSWKSHLEPDPEGTVVYYADAQATVEALQRERDTLREATKVICGHCCEPMAIPSKAVLQSHLSALQGLVREFIEAWDHDGEPNAAAYETVVAKARRALPATPPEELNHPAQTVSEAQATWWATELYPTKDTENFGLAGDFEVMRIEDVQSLRDELDRLITEYVRLFRLGEPIAKMLSELSILPIGCSREQELAWKMAVKNFRHYQRDYAADVLLQAAVTPAGGGKK